MDATDQPIFPMAKTICLLATIALLLISFIYTLNLTLANAAVPYFQGGLSVNNLKGSYIATAFMAGTTISVPFTSALSKRFGSIRVLVASNLLFNGLSVMSGCTSNYVLVVGLRLLQGVVTGPLVPLCQATLMKIYPKGQRIFINNLFSNTLLIGPMMGPFIGGWICFNYSWHWIFFLFVPVGVILTLWVAILFKDIHDATGKLKLDYVSLVLITIIVLSLQVLLDKGRQYMWWESTLIWYLTIIILVALVYLVAWSVLQEDSLLDLSLFKYRTFTMAFFLSMLSYSVYYAILALIPIWFRYFMGYNAVWAGATVLPLVISPLLIGLFVDRFIKRFGYTRVLSAALLFLSLGCFYFAFFTPYVDFRHVVYGGLILGTGAALYISPLVGLAVYEVEPKKLEIAAGMAQFFRAFAAGIGTSSAIGLWKVRMHFHYINLIENVNPYRNASQEWMEQIKKLGFTGQQKFALMEEIIGKQVASLSFNDLMWGLAWLCLILSILTTLFRKRRVSKRYPKRKAIRHLIQQDVK